MSSADDTTAIVLAAGLGKRMKSALPKVLHPVAGRPLLSYPLTACVELGVCKVVVVVSRAAESDIQRYLETSGFPQLSMVVQDPPLGTGDAVRAALPEVDTPNVVIVCGDTPLLSAENLVEVRKQLESPTEAKLAVLSCRLPDPVGYGRILRGSNAEVIEIKEDRDLSDAEERAVKEVNAGVYAARTEALSRAISTLRPANAQGEYYLTDVVKTLAAEARVSAIEGQSDNLIGVNDLEQLEQAEQLLYRAIRRHHRLAGATVRGDAKIDALVVIEPDAVIESGVCLRGRSVVRRGAHIDVGCVVEDCEIGEQAQIKPYCVMSRSSVGKACEIGPFARLRPESVIEDDARIGNFVETKKTRLRRGAKANHLSYLGDGDVGEKSNIGAGTIFCNYDGYGKHPTVIEAGAFIGSDSQLVAPVRIGKNAFVASGTTVTEDVPEDSLALGRVKQVNKVGYAPRLHARLAQAAGKPVKKA